MTKGFQCDRCGKWFHPDPKSHYTYSYEDGNPDVSWVKHIDLEFCGGCHENIVRIIKNERTTEK